MTDWDRVDVIRAEWPGAPGDYVAIATEMRELVDDEERTVASGDDKRNVVENAKAFARDNAAGLYVEGRKIAGVEWVDNWTGAEWRMLEGADY